MSERGHSTVVLVVGMFGGLLVGSCGAGVAAGFFSYRAVRDRELAARSGWELTPVVVATSDLSEGKVLTYQDVAQRPVPRQFVTASNLTPAGASAAVGARLRHEPKQGDPLRWVDLEAASDGGHALPAP